MSRRTDSGAIELGYAEMFPAWAYAMQRGTWRLTYHAGAQALEAGSRVRFYPPFTFDNSHNSCVRWETGTLTAASTASAALSVCMVNTMQKAYSDRYSVNVIEVSVETGVLTGGDSFTVVMGDQRAGGRPAVAQWLSGPDMPFYTAVAMPNSDIFQTLARFPVFTVLGGTPERLTAVVPSTLPPERTFALRLKAEDACTNTSSLYQSELRIEPDEGLCGPEESAVSMRENGLKNLPGFSAAGSGIWRVRVRDLEHRETVSNPVSTEFTRPGEHIFWGEIHAHTELSDGVGSEDRFYEYARNEALLDFSAISEHGGGRGWWPCCIEAAARHDDPGKFATLLGYETAWGGGHANIYARGLELPVCNTRDKAELQREREDMLRLVREGSALLIPHHTNDGLVKQAALFHWEQFDPALIRVAEICQMRGSFEMDRPGPNVLFEGNGCSIQDGLQQGFRFGFTGGTDNHCGRPGAPMRVCFHAGHRVGSADTCDLRRPYFDRTLCGLTAVFASKLGREDIFDSLHARRCYATTGARILLSVEVNGLRAGEEGTFRAPVGIRVRVAGTAPLQSIVIVRNNEDIRTEEGRGWDQTLEWEDSTARPGCWYYARAVQKDGHAAWSSPVWLD